MDLSTLTNFEKLNVLNLRSKYINIVKSFVNQLISKSNSKEPVTSGFIKSFFDHAKVCNFTHAGKTFFMVDIKSISFSKIPLLSLDIKNEVAFYKGMKLPADFFYELLDFLDPGKKVINAIEIRGSSYINEKFHITDEIFAINNRLCAMSFHKNLCQKNDLNITATFLDDLFTDKNVGDDPFDPVLFQFTSKLLTSVLDNYQSNLLSERAHFDSNIVKTQLGCFEYLSKNHEGYCHDMYC